MLIAPCFELGLVSGALLLVVGCPGAHRPTKAKDMVGEAHLCSLCILGDRCVVGTSVVPCLRHGDVAVLVGLIGDVVAVIADPGPGQQ